MGNNLLADTVGTRHVVEKRLTSRPPPRDATKVDTNRLIRASQVYLIVPDARITRSMRQWLPIERQP